MKKAQFWKKEKNSIRCNLCPRSCLIEEDNFGFCNARKNIKGVLYSMVYCHPVSINMDPIEKKPLYHFMPKTYTLSIGTIGCNLGCLHCQNWQLSRAKFYETKEIKPKDIVELAKKNKVPSISYTYNEPTVFYEYVLDTAKLAKKNKIKNIIVSNGYINEKPLKKLLPYIDAANIDLKSFNEEFYNKVCSASLEPVLKSLKMIKKAKVHLEITNLIIPGYNDDPKEIENMCKWIKKNLGDVPLHFSRFFPYYKMQDVPRTPIETLTKAEQIAKKYLTKVHLGNV